jgi:membrane protein insertase Oxa1/YidC/SpoIIIJ
MAWLPDFQNLTDQEQPWILSIIVVVTLVNLLLLGLVIRLFYKVQQLIEKLDRISTDAGKFVQMGMMYFKKQQ